MSMANRPVYIYIHVYLKVMQLYLCQLKITTISKQRNSTITIFVEGMPGPDQSSIVDG